MMRASSPDARRSDRASTSTIVGAIAMVGGSALYMADQTHSVRNWHLLLVPALCLMALGAILAFVGSITGGDA